MPDLGSLDDNLLTRLNALQKSSVSLDTSLNLSSTPATPPKPTDDLAARFARLGSASPSSSPQPSRTTSTNNAHAPLIAPGAPGYLQGIAQGVGGDKVEFNEEDEKSLEELLGELNGATGDRQQWDVSGKEQADVGRLLKDMKKILPEVINSRAKETQGRGTEVHRGHKEELTDWESIEVNVAGGSVGPQQEDTEHDMEDSDNEHGQKKTEDDEADDLIARVMAELEISKKYDPPSPQPGDNASDSGDQLNKPNEDTTNDSFTLPSAPTSLPEDDFDRAQAIEDAFTARLAALAAPSPSHTTDALGLPSAPSFAPHKKPPVSSNLQARLDEEIDTWCIICQDDATLRCLGCDDDLYCQNCWMEGHKGESAGYEERRHKAVLFAKKKVQAAA